MSKASKPTDLGSGLLLLDRESVDTLPDGPAHFRLRASGQRIVYTGFAGDKGLWSAIESVLACHPTAGITYLEYATMPSPEAAEQAARKEIEELRPLCNEGFGRFRNTDVSLPKKGHRIRKAMQNP